MIIFLLCRTDFGERPEVEIVEADAEELILTEIGTFIGQVIDVFSEIYHIFTIHCC